MSGELNQLLRREDICDCAGLGAPVVFVIVEICFQSCFLAGLDDIFIGDAGRALQFCGYDITGVVDAYVEDNFSCLIPDEIGVINLV